MNISYQVLSYRHEKPLRQLMADNVFEFHAMQLNVKRYLELDSAVGKLRKDNAVAIVAIDDERIVGFCGISLVQFNKKPYAGIWYGVDQHSRRMGIATAMIEKAIARLITLKQEKPYNFDFERLIIHSLEHNEASIAIARKFGLERDDSIDFERKMMSGPSKFLTGYSRSLQPSASPGIDK